MKNIILIWILNLTLSNYVYASTPLWTFTPLTPTTILIKKFEIKFVEYLITNQSNITHNLAIQPFPFEVVSPGPFACGEVFVLAPNQSCILSLLIKGFDTQDTYMGGPALCEFGNQDLCYIPSKKDILTVIYSNT